MTVTAVRNTMTSPTVPPPQKISRISNFSVASLLADTRPRSPTAAHNPHSTASATITTTTTPSPSTASGNTDILLPTNLSQSSASPPLSHHSHQSLLGHPNLHSATSTPPHHLHGAMHHGHHNGQHHLHLNHHHLASHHHHLTNSHHLHHHLGGADANSMAAKDERYTPHSSNESDVDYDSNQEDSIVDIEDLRADDGDRDADDTGCSTPPDSDGKSPVGGGMGSGHPMLGSPNALGHVPIRPTPFSALAAAAAAWGGMPWPGARQMGPFGPPGMFPGQGFGGGGHGGPGGKNRSLFVNVSHYI